jgi:hypothetical protein
MFLPPKRKVSPTQYLVTPPLLAVQTLFPEFSEQIRLHAQLLSSCQ